MNTMRMNITLPIDVGRWLKGTKNASAFITESIREKLKRQEQAKHTKELEKAYMDCAREESELAAEWDAVASDGL